VNTGVGTFLVIPLWAAFIIVPLIGIYLARWKGGSIETPYLAGENIGEDGLSFRTIADSESEFKVAGMFLDDVIVEDKVARFGVAVGALLVLLMFVLAVI